MVSGSVGSRVRALRDAASVGSRELDRLAGLREGHVAVLESRTGDIEARTAVAIAKVFGVSVAFLSDGTGGMPDAEELRRAVAVARAEHAAPIASEAHPS